MKTVTTSNKLISRILPQRAAKSKKGDNGIVLVVGGSRLYHGAPLLAALAAMRSGSDLVYVAVPRPISIPIRSYSPNLIVLPLPDDRLTLGSVNRLVGMLPKKVHSAAIGMGLSVAKKDALIRLLTHLLGMDSRLVLDAGALIPDVLPVVRKKMVVMTPHAGEFERLFEANVGKQEKERITNVKKKASEYEVTLLFKGWTDVISDGKRVALNKTHNSAMTVGGTGDVLSGITAGLLARSMNTFEAAAAAAYFNGLAGNLAYKRLGLHLTPTDIIDELPNAMKRFDKIKK